MANGKTPRSALMPSLLDRLIDPDSLKGSWQQGYDVRQMAEAVRRDLEELLNTHRSYSEIPDQYPEVRHSLLTYGLPDLVSFSATTTHERRQIGQMVEETIAFFEPRLRNVRAVLIEGTHDDRTVRFHVEASLNVDPAPEVAFETILELTTGHAAIRAGETSS